MRISLNLIVGMVVALFFLAGCQTAPEKPVVLGPPPPPMSMEEQLSILNGRAAALVTVRARGSVKTHWVDRDGKSHDYQVDGTLLLDQNPPLEAEASYGPDLLLEGRYIGQDVFEIGMNSQSYWVIDHQDKRGYIGSRALMNQLPTSALTLRPDRILAMLAFTPVQADASHSITMRVTDDPAEDILLVFLLKNGQPVQLQKEIMVNRRTGQVARVILYGDDGQVQAVGILSDYEPISHYQGQGTVPLVPTRVFIEYPAGQAQINLKFDDVTTTLKVEPADAFAQPNLNGLKMVSLDKYIITGD